MFSSTNHKYLLSEELATHDPNVTDLDLSQTLYILDNPGFFKLSLLPSLVVLDLSECGIRNWDPVCDIVRLESLNLSRNSIRLLPARPRLARLQRLTILDLSGNRIDGQTAELEKLHVCAALTDVRLSGDKEQSAVRERVDKLQRELDKTRASIDKLEMRLSQTVSETEAATLAASLSALRLRDRRIADKLAVGNLRLRQGSGPRETEEHSLTEFVRKNGGGRGVLDLVLHQHRLIERLARPGTVVEDRDELIQLLIGFATDCSRN